MKQLIEMGVKTGNLSKENAEQLLSLPEQYQTFKLVTLATAISDNLFKEVVRLIIAAKSDK